MTRIKCSYDDCFRHFDSQQAMISHKDKEPLHSYCRRCDVDCADDMEFLIHQIQSEKHICCPVCGLEFKSNGGRDLHVEQQHPMKQNLQCVGCEAFFTRASLLMSHIENDECPIITLEHFERQRAEKQLEKDAWSSVLNSNNAACAPSLNMVGSEADTNIAGGATLLDQTRGYADDWRGGVSLGSSHEVLQPVPSNSTSRAPRPPVEGISQLSLNKFPALAPASVAPVSKQTKMSVQPASDGDLLSFDQPEVRITAKPAAKGVWADAEKKRKVFKFDSNGSEISSPSPLSEIGAGSNIITPTAATYGGGHGVPSRADQFTKLSAAQQALQKPTPLPPAARPHGPNTTNSKISVAKSIPSATKLDANKFYSSIHNKYVCPSATCSRQFDTIEGFNAHLITGAHVGGRTTCPACLKNFASTTALITHCESPSRRCNIRKTANYNQVMRELTGGLIGTEGHLVDGSVKYKANDVQEW